MMNVRGEGATVDTVADVVRATVEGVEIVAWDYESDALPGQVVVDESACGGKVNSIIVESGKDEDDERLRCAFEARGWQVS